MRIIMAKVRNIKIFSYFLIALLSFYPVIGSAKGWYDTCGKNKAENDLKQRGNFYVGGPYNKNHIHVGSDFLHVTSNVSNTKFLPEKDKFSCQEAGLLLKNLDKAGFDSPAAVRTCLEAVCTDYCEGRGAKPCAGE